MCFLRYILLAVTLLAAIAGADDLPPGLLDNPSKAATPSKDKTLLRARAAHRVSVSVSDLHWAALEDDVAEVKRLIAAGADLNATETLWGGERPLHYAAVSGGSGSVRALIAAGVPLEARDDGGDTALREALRPDDDNFRALKVLLAAGADPGAVRSGSGSTALHEAIQIEHAGGWNAVYLLRIFGADPNAAQIYGSVSGVTPLHLAALRPWDDFWGRALMWAAIDPHQRVANVNAKDSTGKTPLHWLVARSASAADRSVLEWLHDNGADINAVDNYGSTPLDWAEFAGLEDLAGVLRGGMGGVNRRAPNPNP